jgi:uncharacterized membrane protein
LSGEPVEGTEVEAAAGDRRVAWAVIGAVSFVLLLLLSPLWPVPLLDKADAVGAAVCHRLATHSFHLAGRQLPLCARCTGTFTGALLGLVGLLALKKGKAAVMPPARVLGLLVTFIVVMAIDGLNSYVSLFPNFPVLLYQPQNVLRLLTGTLHGLALVVIVFPIFNFTLWKEPRNEPVLSGLRELAILVGGFALPMVLIVQAQIDVLLYPVAIISVLGVLAMLTAVNALIVVIAMRREARAVAWWDAALPIALGFAATLVEVGVIVLVRWQFSIAFGLPF